jgi:hypothetical protein
MEMLDLLPDRIIHLGDHSRCKDRGRAGRGVRDIRGEVRATGPNESADEGEGARRRK